MIPPEIHKLYRTNIEIMLESDKTEERLSRHEATAEDFTPDSVVEDMLSRIPDTIFSDVKKTVCDPCAGIGNLLATILTKRLQSHCKNWSDVYWAVASLFGVELMQDNVDTLKKRLNDIIDNQDLWKSDSFDSSFTDYEGNVAKGKDIEYAYIAWREGVREVIDHNIVCSNADDWNFIHWCPEKELVPAVEALF